VMRVLRDHGLPATSLTDVFRATIIAKLTYCSPEWSGLTSAQDGVRIDAFLRRSKRYGYCADSVPITDIFRRILNNESHVLHQLLPETRKPCCRKETARCCKCSFRSKFANNILYKYKTSHASKATLQSSKHAVAKHNLTQNQDSKSIKVTRLESVEKQ